MLLVPSLLVLSDLAVEEVTGRAEARALRTTKRAMNPPFIWGAGSSYEDAVQETSLMRPPHHPSSVGKVPARLGTSSD